MKSEFERQGMTGYRRGNGEIRRRYAMGATGALLLVVGFFFGVYVGELDDSRPTNAVPGPDRVVNYDEPVPEDLPEEADFRRFWEVWDIVKSRYVEQPVDDVELFYGAVSGIVSSLDDPYSLFLKPEIAERFEADLAGTFEGIGAEIGIKNDQLKIIAPLPDTPAERAGLKAGDSIMAIDDVETYGMSIDEAVNRIRGPQGEEVRLLIMRGEEVNEVPIVRDTIKVVSVRWRVEQAGGLSVGVIEMHHFNETTGPAFEEAVQDILLADPDGLVLDLRNNPGGFLNTAVDVAGEWVLRDVVVKEKFSDGSARNYVSNGNARLADLPTVVLVNGGSASASEIVAGALQHYGKARIVGEQTFGKGSVQDYVEFDDGSSLKLTIALWLTPGDLSIAEEGITPDVEVEYTEEDYNNDLDPQFDRAVEVLSRWGEEPAPEEESAN